MDADKIERGIRLFLEGIGEDPTREGLKDTPARVARMWQEFEDRRCYTCTSFSSDDYDEMVLLSSPLYSLCEHHLLPFFGTVHVAYIPQDNRLLGLSKLCRIVDRYALRPSIQERLTSQIAKRLQEETQASGVGVVIEAEHLCMSMRGVQKASHVTRTSKLLGLFSVDSTTKQEFLSLIGR